MFDGWVLKGEKFPSRQDHQLPLHQRYTDYCSSTGPGATSRSSQNVAMIFFRIHSPDSGFTLAVKKLHNPFRESFCMILEVIWGLKSPKAKYTQATFIQMKLNCKQKRNHEKKYGLASKSNWCRYFLCVLKWGLLSCVNACLFSQSFALGRALIKAEGDRKRLNERVAPVFQLLDKHVVHTVSSNITITVWLQDNDGQRRSTDTKKRDFEWIIWGKTAQISGQYVSFYSYIDH